MIAQSLTLDAKRQQRTGRKWISSAHLHLKCDQGRFTFQVVRSQESGTTRVSVSKTGRNGNWNWGWEKIRRRDKDENVRISAGAYEAC